MAQPAPVRTLRQEIGRVRAQAEPQGQLAIDRLLGLLDKSDNFHCAALACIECLPDEPHDEVLRRLAQKFVAERRDLVAHTLAPRFRPMIDFNLHALEPALAIFERVVLPTATALKLFS